MNHADTPEKKEIVKHWQDQHAGEPSAENIAAYERMEGERYETQPFIHSFVQFTRWHRKRVLEIGVGLGAEFLQFCRAGAEAYGIDFTRSSIETTYKVCRYYDVKCHLAIADAESLPFCDNVFDLVFTYGVLHHTPDTQRAVKEIKRVLKPGGWLYGMVYNRFSTVGFRNYLKYAFLKGRPFTSLSSVFRSYMESPGTKAYTKKEVKALFHEFAGLTVTCNLEQEIYHLKSLGLPGNLLRFLPEGIGTWIHFKAQKGPV